MDNLYKIIRFFVITGLSLALIGVATAFMLFSYYAKDLPKLDSLEDYNPPVVSEVFSHDGTKIGEFWNEKRIVLPPDELPRVIVQAIVSSEDDRFFEHRGIDYKGIIRAFFENLKAGHVVQGGSTITQQVTKALLLSKERTITRKIKEAILATRIERKFSKDEILYLYLNQIYFGNRAYGIEAAAQNYFHKTARELDIAEAAMIAGLAKAPSLYSPIKNPEKAKQRQDYVIDRMAEVGYITTDQAIEARKKPVEVFLAQTDKAFNNQFAPWFTEYVRRQIQDKYGEQVPYTHGLKIYTTLDLEAQKAADEAIFRGIRELDQRQGYQGPMKTLHESEFASFIRQQHIRIIQNERENPQNLTKLTDEEMLKTKPRFDSQKRYEALITGLDSTGQNILVTLGKVKGKIRVHDYKWARERNTNLAGYNDVYYVKNPAVKFHIGDVILVSPKKPEEKEYQDKGYSRHETYFTLEQNPEVEAALFSYEPPTGFVRAMVGGSDFEKSEFNRATQALRQTGSVFKPFVYAAALDKGYTPNTIIEDAPIYYEYSKGRFWSPQNYGGGYRGPTSFRAALVNSRNVVTVRILMDIGVDFVTAYVRKFGITTPINKYYSMALGANDMKLMEICRAYGTFPNGGILPELVFITRMTDRYGRILEEYQPREIVPFAKQLEKNLANKEDDDEENTGYNQKLDEAGREFIERDDLDLTEIEKRILYGSYIPDGYTISPRTAYTMVQLMTDIVNYGTGYRVRDLKREAAGKTGTTNDESDAWFIGYTPELFSGIWVGFDQLKKLGVRETGGKTAAPIFLYYMRDVLKDRPVAKFEIPPQINLEDLKAPIDVTAGDAEAGGIGEASGSGADFFIYDF